MHDFLNQPMGEIAANLPGATAVFQRYGLDFCCGGAQTLGDAVNASGVNAADIVAALEAIKPTGLELDVKTLGDSDLTRLIVQRYHEEHRAQIPELIRLATRVEAVHRHHPVCPTGLAAHLEQMHGELLSHMQKEEMILFPMLSNGQGAMAGGPVSVMRHEHDDHGVALDKMMQLAHQGQLPDEACGSWRALYTGVKHLREALMEHIHIENNVLFHRVDGRLGSH